MGGDTISLPDSSIDDEDLSTINQQFRDCSSEGEPNRAKIFDAVVYGCKCSIPNLVELVVAYEVVTRCVKLNPIAFTSLINVTAITTTSHCQLCITTIAASFRLRPTLSIFPWFSVTTDTEGVGNDTIFSVTKNKKRIAATVPGLRSNKKVSGLVDKWKAVKEELHEDEEDEEPENALEALENKKQREIEQWHAQQIATKEAKDNVNFQPLGGDWRESFRRKRAKKQWKLKNIKERAMMTQTKSPILFNLQNNSHPVGRNGERRRSILNFNATNSRRWGKYLLLSLR
ncbi:hypothetical protein L1887_01078 [Cichorium endivia]|nr:hypothetical protein L1887_01078 [Cichorium endivia]